jgi:hypothetical protein
MMALHPGVRRILTLLACAALAVSFFGPVLWQGQSLYARDLFNFHYPLWATSAAALRAGDVPLWNPRNNFGQNIAGNPNYLLFYPPAWIRAVMHPLDALNLFIIGHYVLGAWAFGALCRRWGLADSVAVVGGLAYALGGAALSLHCVLNLVPYVALAPALLLALEGLLAGGGGRAAARLALVGGLVGMVFEPMMAAGLAGVALGRVVGFGTGQAQRRAQLRLAGCLVMSVALAGAIAAPAALEGIRLLRQTSRNQAASDEQPVYGLHPARAVGLWIPNPYRFTSGITPGFTGWRYTEGRQPYLASLFVGFSSVLLVLAGLRGERGRLGRRAAGTGAVFLLLGASPWVPWLGAAARFAPILNWGRYTEKYAFFAAGAFLVAALAGLDRLYRGERMPLRGRGELAALTAGVALALAAGAAIPGASLGSLVPVSLAGAVLAALALLVAPPPGRAWTGDWRAGIAGAVLLLELLAGNRFAVPMADRGLFTEPVPVLQAAGRLDADLATVRIAMDDPPADIRYFGRTDSDVWISRFYHLAGYPYPGFTSGAYYAFNPTQDLLEGIGQGRLSRWFGGAPLADRVRLMQRLGIGWFISPRRLEHTDLELEGTYPTGASHRYGLYRVSGGGRRFQLWTEWRPVRPGPVSASDLAEPGPASPYLEPAGPLPAPSPGDGSPSRVDLMAEWGLGLRLMVWAPAGGVLVARDAWYPGWRARLDGREVPVHRADHLFRAVTVPSGRHRLEFRYEPAGGWWGWGAAGAALIAALALAVWPRRREAAYPKPAGPRKAAGA